MDDDIHNLKDAAKRTGEALGRIADGEGDFLLDAEEVCSGLEEMCELIGVQSVGAVKLRRALEKRGLRRR